MSGQTLMAVPGLVWLTYQSTRNRCQLLTGWEDPNPRIDTTRNPYYEWY